MQQPAGFVFGPFRFDVGNERLWRGQEIIPLRHKALVVLQALVTQAGQLMTKDALLAAGWSETVVSEMTLTATIRELRRALGDHAQRPKFIETVHGRGYRFLAPVTVLAPLSECLPPGVASRLLRPVPVHQPPFFAGRSEELTQLYQYYVAALQGARQMVCITGAAGIGKTALVDTCATRLAATVPLWLGRGQCLDHHGAGEAYLPLLEILRQCAESPYGHAFIALLQHRAPTWLMSLPGLLSPAEQEALRGRVSAWTRERMLRELTEAIEVLAAQQSVCFILEDLQWSDVATLDWLAYMAQRRGPARLLVLVTCRPVETLQQGHPVRQVIQELQAHGQCVELRLEALPEAEVAAYVAQWAGSPRLPEGLVRVLYHRTNGNPLLLKLLVSDLVQRGTLLCGPSGWSIPAGLAAVAAGVPETLRHMIGQQLEHLTPVEQQILEAASVTGVTCVSAAIAAALGQDREDVEVHCDALVRRAQFLHPLGSMAWSDGSVTACYRFHHDLYRETLYERVPVSRRQRWHRQISECLDAGFGPRVREQWSPERAAVMFRLGTS